MNESAVGFVFILAFILLTVVGCCRYWHARRQLDQRLLSAATQPLQSGDGVSYGSAAYPTEASQITAGVPVCFSGGVGSETQNLATSDLPPWVAPDWAEQSRYATCSSPRVTEGGEGQLQQ